MRKRQLALVRAARRGSKDLLTHLQAAIHLIPHIGGSIATYLETARAERAAERTLFFLDYFSSRLARLEARKIDIDFLRSESFAEQFAEALERASKTTTNQRIRRFADVLLNNAMLDSKARDRTDSIMSFVEGVSDLDAFVLLGYGPPGGPSMLAPTKARALDLVAQLAAYLRVTLPPGGAIVEAMVFLDNLGLLWLNEQPPAVSTEKGQHLPLKEFSSFRTPLGSAVAAAIAPPEFYKTPKRRARTWRPSNYVSAQYRQAGPL